MRFRHYSIPVRILGTPTTAKWPGFAEYPESQDKSYLHDCAPVKFESLFPSLEPAGLDLLSVNHRGLPWVFLKCLIEIIAVCTRGKDIGCRGSITSIF